MTKAFTAVVAILIGAMWIVDPAAAQTTSDKMENKAERAKDKMVETKDKVVEKIKGNKHAKNRAMVSSKAEDRNVRAAQQALRDQGFNPGPIDGRMGPRTSAALRDLPDEARPDGERSARRRHDGQAWRPQRHLGLSVDRAADDGAGRAEAEAGSVIRTGHTLHESFTRGDDEAGLTLG